MTRQLLASCVEDVHLSRKLYSAFRMKQHMPGSNVILELHTILKGKSYPCGCLMAYTDHPAAAIESMGPAPRSKIQPGAIARWITSAATSCAGQSPLALWVLADAHDIPSSIPLRCSELDSM